MKLTANKEANNDDFIFMRNIPTQTIRVCVAACALTLMTNCLVADQNASSGVIRIKAGKSEPVKDAEGNVWLAEQGFEGGQTIERPDIQIDNTKSPDLCRSEHYSMDSFSWPVPNGKYAVKLHFAETFDGITGPGQRVFCCLTLMARADEAAVVRRWRCRLLYNRFRCLDF